MAKIFSVNSVQLQILKSNPVQILVVAHGMAATSGWKNIDLVPIKGSEGDGVLDLEFVGTPPAGISLPVLTPVTGDFVIEDGADKLAGVMVHARTNNMTALVSGERGQATSPGGPSAGVSRFMAMADVAGAQGLTTLAVGEEGDWGTFASRWAESPPLTPQIETVARTGAEKLPITEKFATAAAEKFAAHLGEKNPFIKEIRWEDILRQKPGGFGEGDPGPDPYASMFLSPFGVR